MAQVREWLLTNSKERGNEARFQRLAYRIIWIPGTMSQANMEIAPLALKGHASWVLPVARGLHNLGEAARVEAGSAD